MKLNIFLVCFSVLFASGCVSSGSARLSEREVMVQSSADPVCGAHGALIAAQKQAAIETIKAGYDKYIVLGASSSNNVQTHILPGATKTRAKADFDDETLSYKVTTRHRSDIVTTGSFDHEFMIRMFREGEPGAFQAVSARAILGPQWMEIVHTGVFNCM